MLRQQALLTINNFPSMIARLRDDLGELTQARSGMAGMVGIAPPRKKGTPPSVPPRVGSAAAAVAAERDEDDALSDDEEEELDEETETEIKDIERIGKDIERVLLRIGTSQEPLADKDLLALKRLGALDQGTMAASHTRGGEETCDRGNDCHGMVWYGMVWYGSIAVRVSCGSPTRIFRQRSRCGEW